MIQALYALLVVLSLARPAAVAVYSVGPSQTYATIGAALSSNALGPGDEVWIYAKSTPYYEKFVINAAGTAEAPIVIRGVVAASGSGERPIIDGKGAVTAPKQNFWNEGRGLVKIGGANIPAVVITGPNTTSAAHIRIENLHFRNAHAGFSFTDDSGKAASYVNNAACVYIEEGSHIELVNNVITGCGNGIFVTPGVEHVLIEGNYIYGNGNVGSIYEHNTYTEALGITYRFNRFGPLCTGCGGNNLKDRSGGLTVAYNLIQGGNRQLDLVDSDEPTIRADPGYRNTYVYGNILFEPDGSDNRQIVHYGGDSGDESKYRHGTLHFYHNTIVSTRVGRTTLVRLSSEAETCDARNNIIYVKSAGSELELLSENRGMLILRTNWMKAGYALSFENQGSGSVTLFDTVTGTDPGFADVNFTTSIDVRLSGHLLPSAALATGVPTVDHEYVLHATSEPRTSTDIGAYGYGITNSKTASPFPPAVTPQPVAANMPTAGPITESPMGTVAPPVTSCTESCDWFRLFSGVRMTTTMTSGEVTGCRERCVPAFFSRMRIASALGWSCGTCA